MEDPIMQKTLNAPRKGRTANRQARRQQLIKATIESIAKHGITNTTLTTVTEYAQLSHGIVNFHFKTKELLFVETLKFLTDEHRNHWRVALQKTGATPQEQLAALISTDFHRSICNAKRLSVWFAFWGEAKSRPTYLKVCGQNDQERQNETERLCQLLKEDGNYLHMDAPMLAKSLLCFIDGLWLNMLLYPQVFKREEAQQDCLTFFAAMFPRHFPLKG